VASPIELQWSEDALADLDWFAAFLLERSPELAATVADAIIARTQILSRHPRIGRPLAGREEYRQLVLQVLGADYVFQYRFDGEHLVILRVFHAREAR
jgi:plasmid stabilization system protein ParE